MEKFKPFIIPVALLVLIDQMVKIVISKVFMKYEFDIIAKVLRFNPELNTRLSYAGNFFELLSSPFVTILLNVFVLFLFLSGYMLYQAKRAHTSFWVKMIMICGISGCLCSLIDKVFWGGSLDFLQIKNIGSYKPQTAPRRIRGCVCSLCGPFQFSLLLRKNVKFRDWQVWPLILSPCG